METSLLYLLMVGLAMAGRSRSEVVVVDTTVRDSRIRYQCSLGRCMKDSHDTWGSVGIHL